MLGRTRSMMICGTVELKTSAGVHEVKFIRYNSSESESKLDAASAPNL